MITREIKLMAEKSNAAQTERREDLEQDLSRLNSMREAWGSQYLMERVLDIMHGEIQRQRLHYGGLSHVEKDCKRFEGKLKRIANAIKDNGLDLEEVCDLPKPLSLSVQGLARWEAAKLNDPR